MIETKESVSLRTILNLEGRNKHIYSLVSFSVVLLLTLLMYLVPDYYFLERVTYDVVMQTLNLYQFDVQYDGRYNEFLDPDRKDTPLNTIVEFLSTFLNTHDGSPVIRSNWIKSVDITNGRFAIVRACTAMQAGALLIALIVVTPAKNKQKMKATSYSLIALIIGNFLRIALIIGMTIFLMKNYGLSYYSAWMWSHDVLGKPIGFFGTIGFALIIEKQGVPILNTVSLWIDSLLDIFSFSKK